MGNCSISPTPLIQVGEYEFNPNDIIGAGHHGVLFQGSPRKDKLFEIAVKQINHSFDPKHFKEVETILKKLQTIHHENVAHYIDYYYNAKEAKLYLIIEFCAHGNLNDLIQTDNRSNPLDDLKKNVAYCHQIIAGLVALHEKGIYHGNLRPHNILIHYDILKISDFGLIELEKLSVEGAKKKYSIYKAPELFRGSDEINEKCDIWSLGVIMHQLIYKKRPVEVQGGQYKLNLSNRQGKCDALDDLIEKCLKVNPEERISTEELRKHAFISFHPEFVKGLYTDTNDTGLIAHIGI